MGNIAFNPFVVKGRFSELNLKLKCTKVQFEVMLLGNITWNKCNLTGQGLVWGLLMELSIGE